MLKPIKSNQQYKDALARSYLLMQNNLLPDSEESDDLEIISILVKEYENKQYPVPKPNQELV